MVGVDVLLVGHSHIPFIRKIEGTRVLLNLTTWTATGCKTEASYAVWQDGEISLKSFCFRSPTLRFAKIRALEFPPAVQTNLVHILESGLVM